MTSTPIRLNVFLQQHGVASRRHADELIKIGRVSVDGKVITELGTKVLPDAIVTVDGKPIGKATPNILMWFHKPDLYITSRKDPEGRPTIFDIPALKKLPQNVQSVGRLDFRSEGLLLLTNDGNLAYKLTHPKYAVPKTYAVLLGETLVQSDIAQLKQGIRLEDGFVKADNIKIGSRAFLGTPKRGQWVEVTISEGRNRIIRRMFEMIGLKVIRLVRIGIGNIFLPTQLKAGEVMAVSRDELKILQSLGKNEAKTSLGANIKKTISNKNKGVERKDYGKHLEDRSIQLARKQSERHERIKKEKEAGKIAAQSRRSKKPHKK